MLIVASAGAAAAIRPITDLPLQAAGPNHWRLPAGEYRGSFRIDQPLQLTCAPGAIFQAEGQGNGLLISAPDVSVQGCTFLDWGDDLTAMNAGVFIQPQARGAQLLGNRLQGQGFGIWVDGTQDVSLIGNRIQGDTSVRSQDRGNGIHMYAVHGARVIDNYVRDTRDGIYIDTSYGNLLNYITYSTLQDNVVTDVRDGSTGDTMIAGGEGKALFIYNSLFNRIEHNRFARSAVGIHLTAGSEDNRIAGNAFIDNQRQVKYVASRLQEWSADGRGNYWSDYLGWDRNGDGVGDVAYEPNDNVDRLLWLYPQVRLLMNSPGIELLRWVQRAFPVMKSPGVMDSHPLMQAPTHKEPA